MRLPHIRLRSLATFIVSGGGVALVHALAGEKAAAAAGLAAGLVLSQSDPVVHRPCDAPTSDGARVQAALQGGADATAASEDAP